MEEEKEAATSVLAVQKKFLEDLKISRVVVV